MSRGKKKWLIATIVIVAAMVILGYYDMRVQRQKGRYAEIRTFATGLKLYHLDWGTYPRDLQALLGSAKDAKDAPDLTRGGKIVYEVSEDGQTAFLDGEDIKAIFDDD